MRGYEGCKSELRIGSCDVKIESPLRYVHRHACSGHVVLTGKRHPILRGTLDQARTSHPKTLPFLEHRNESHRFIRFKAVNKTKRKTHTSLNQKYIYIQLLMKLHLFLLLLFFIFLQSLTGLKKRSDRVSVPHTADSVASNRQQGIMTFILKSIFTSVKADSQRTWNYTLAKFHTGPFRAGVKSTFFLNQVKDIVP